jgi:gliding motility-associated-like protein
MENNYKCTRGNGESIALGFYKNFTASTFLTCIHKPVVLLDTIRYYSLNSFNLLNPVPYWNMPARAAANKEKIYWDIGDGKGFAYEGSHPIIRYTKPGTYTIKMIVQDSLGCRDTLVRHNLIRVVDLQPRIGLLQTSYLCAPQIVQFKDLSLVADSIGDTIPSKNDSIVSRQWEFGDETPLSALKDPAHNFTSNRIFTTTLTITTSSGCIDTARQQVELKGPVPLFVIKDTMGCEPFTAQFVNTTGKPLNSWTWYYGDPLNQTFTTTRDTDVLFTYTKAGVYSIKLLGTESVFNPNTGNTIICNSFFPDPSNEIPERKVYVLPTPLMDVRFNDSICTNTPLRLTAFGDPLYNRMTWVYGDRDSVTTQRPDTIQYHSFAAPGLYSFKLIPINSSGTSCNDTVNKTIWVTDVQADFMVDSAQAPLFKFQNTSLMAQRFVWDFGKPSAGSENVSYTTNGLFHYGTDTGSYIVCLRAFNREDCEDSICKRIRIVNARVIIPNVFTPDNNDDRNEAFDIDIDGFTVYKLQIFNRWGTEVFFSERDGYRNDGINWNGKDHNTGEHCSAGTYYFIFTYQLITEPQLKTVHGTVTLIR